MYQKNLMVFLTALCLLGSQASTAVEDTPIFTVGEKWAFGEEIDLMEEVSAEISELEKNIADAIANGEAKDNASGIELKSFDLKNKAILGFYHTGEIIDDFDNMYHIQTEQSLYSHTVIGTTVAAMLPNAGTYDLRLECTNTEDEGEENCQLTDATTKKPLALTEKSAEISGGVHYVAKITEDTWWTQDSHQMVKTELTVKLSSMAEINIKNVPNITYTDGVSLLETELEPRFDDCEDSGNNSTEICYETVKLIMETIVLGLDSETSFHIIIEFDKNEPVNVFDLPLKENEYWEGKTNVTISGDFGGKIDVRKPEITACPDLDCDKLPEMQELYSALTDAIQEFHSNETIDITVDRNNDGMPDVITEWNDIFPMYIPELWMDDIFKRVADEVTCDDNDPECDETAEEEYEKLNLRIENNRFAFGPYSVPAEEGIPYAFETDEKQTATASDGTSYEGFQVFPTNECSDKNPDEDACSDEENDDGVIQPFSNHDYNGCEEDPFCDSEIIWFHNAETGRPAYISMDMPNLKDEGYELEMAPIEHSEAIKQIEANADPENPRKSDITPSQSSSDEITDDSALPGFGTVTVITSLLLVGRRYRK